MLNTVSYFDLDPNWVHLNCLFLSSHPKPVRESIDNARKRFDNNPTLAWQDYVQNIEPEIRRTISQDQNLDADDIALTSSSTAGLGLILAGIKLNADHEILISSQDHYSAALSARYAKQRTGCHLRVFEPYQDASRATPEEIIKSTLDAINEQTRILLLTWVHSSTGVKIPLKEICDQIQLKNKLRSDHQQIMTLVDGTHGFGIEPEKIGDLGCDIFLTSCHKWLHGPRGTGLLWAHPGVWKMTRPTIPPYCQSAFSSWMENQPMPAEPFGLMMTPGGFLAFEHFCGLPAAFRFRQLLGAEEIHNHVKTLCSRAMQGLRLIDRIKIISPLVASLGSALLCFIVKGKNPDEVVAWLKNHRIVASTTPYPKNCARITPSIYNNMEDIDKFLAVMKKI